MIPSNYFHWSMDINLRPLLRGQIASLESTLWKIPNPQTEYQELLAACDDPNVPTYQIEQRRKRLEEMAGICHKPVDAWPKTDYNYLLPFGLPDFVPKVLRWHRNRDISVFILSVTTSISQWGRRNASECYTDGCCFYSSNSGELTRYEAVQYFGIHEYDQYEAFFEQFGRAQLEL